MFTIEIVVLYFCFYINACRNLMHASTISGRVYYHASNDYEMQTF